MKKLVCFLLVAILLLSTAGCATVRIKSNSTGKVVYHCNGISFEDDLTAEELAAVVGILNGKEQKMALFSGTPSCGFDPNIAIIINDTRYAIACDKCGTLQNCSNLCYIDVSDSERLILEEIFTSRGGKFPCI